MSPKLFVVIAVVEYIQVHQSLLRKLIKVKRTSRRLRRCIGQSVSLCSPHNLIHSRLLTYEQYSVLFLPTPAYAFFYKRYKCA